MAGPVLTIELDGPPPDDAMAQLGAFLTRISSNGYTTKRLSKFDFHVVPELLGLTDSDRPGPRPFFIEMAGPGFGNEEYLKEELAEGPYLLPLIGFVPTHEVAIVAMCNGDVDHRATVLLTAAVMEILGGVANVELLARQKDLAKRTPGLIAMVDEPWPSAFGTTDFLDSWLEQPDFRLLK